MKEFVFGVPVPPDGLRRVFGLRSPRPKIRVVRADGSQTLGNTAFTTHEGEPSRFGAFGFITISNTVYYRPSRGLFPALTSKLTPPGKTAAVCGRHR